MTKSVEGTAIDASCWPRSPSSERFRKLTVPADERAAIVRAMDPSMVRI
jgi:hypothetical protein